MSERAAALLERITRSASEAAIRLRVRSALNPLLWLCALTSLPAIAAIPFAVGATQVALLLIAIVPPTVTCIGFLYFMKNDPDKLQSEEYQIQKRVLDIIEEKGNRFPVLATSLEAIANPHLRRLPKAAGGDEGEES